jgi:thiamine-phosphate pyrophosphorylase
LSKPNDALAGGDVASVIIARDAALDAEYVKRCQSLVAVAKRHDVAAIAVNDTVAMGRSGADGILVEQPDDGFRDLVARFSPQNIVGFSGNFTRHRALELGEAEPDFLLFGKIAGDIRANPHPKNLALGEWWSQIVEIPSAVMAGSDIESVVECAACGVEFVAVGKAVFDHGGGPREAVERANRILDDHAAILSQSL